VLAQAVVLAVITAILGSGASGAPVRHGELLPGMTTAITVLVGLSLFGVLLTVVRLLPRRSAVR
jgi:hypothetical protein